MKEFKITDYIKFPLKVDEYGIYVFDANNDMVLSSVNDDILILKEWVDKLNSVSNLQYKAQYDKSNQLISDYNDNPMTLVRGWGRIQYMENPEWVQDNIGQWIIDKLNE